MRLKNLDARFLKVISKDGYDIVDSLAEADGVMFQCPKCALQCEAGTDGVRKFFRGAHYVICWFVGKVPDDLDPKPGRWTPVGTGLDDITFMPGDPPRNVSVLLTGPGCGWHGHVVSGEATLT